MPRTQVIRQPVLRSNDDLNNALGEMILCKGRIDTRKAALEAAITELRNKAEQDMKADLERFARLEHDIQEYCEYNRATLFSGDRRSLKLPNGTVSFRMHPPSVQIMRRGKHTLATVLQAIKTNFPKKLSDWIRTKEELNKEVLVAVDPSELAVVGLEVVQKESFGYELNLEDSAAQASATSARVVDAATA